MTQIKHGRSTRAALLGLFLQLFAAGVVLVLAYTTAGYERTTTDTTPYVHALLHLSWYMLAGVPIWFIAVLVFRQRQLAELETLDLEQLKREKEASGAGQAIFDEEGRGFRVAEARLVWMQKWLIPTFGLLVAIIAVGGGAWLWRSLHVAQLTLRHDVEALRAWGTLDNVEIGMVVLGIVMCCTFAYSRYASGMGRVPQWRLLRGCGSYLLGNSVAAGAALVVLGIAIYAKDAYWLNVLAYVIPIVMIVLGLETFINFVLDVYRPRTPGVEPRASFDSRLLGLVAEPGGIAHSITEAINYQFGFEVSQTWFYQLLQRAAVPLLIFGGLTLWLLTCLVVVQPDERVIVERFGRQLRAETPLGPGPHLKLPWPIDVARKYNTGQLRELHIGFKIVDAEPDHEARANTALPVLWTDTKHLGQEHYDFLVPLPPKAEGETPAPESQPAEDLLDEDSSQREESAAVPVNLMRMDVVVQYRIRPKELHLYTRSTNRPKHMLRDLAWREVVRLNASHHVDALLGELRSKLGRQVKKRLQDRADHFKLGVEIVYCGLHNIHPEKTVAEAFRNVVNAEQEKIASIREALVGENKRLSAVAGAPRRAKRLAHAINKLTDSDVRVNDASHALRDVDRAVWEPYARMLDELSPLFTEAERAGWRADLAAAQRDQIERNYQLSMRYSQGDRIAAEERLASADAEAEAAQARLSEALEPLREQMRAALTEPQSKALIDLAGGRAALVFWNAELESQLTDLQGAAAVRLAEGRAMRWGLELSAAAEVTRLEREREAFHAAPNVYKTRLWLSQLAERIATSRKLFMAFDATGRDVHLRYQAEEQARPDVEFMEPEQEGP